MRPLASLVDGVFVINLDRRTDRLAQVTEELGRFGIEFERFRAPPIEETDWHGQALSGPGNKPTHYAAGRTHQAVIALAKARGHRGVMIFEDDVVLAPGFLSVARLAEQELTRRRWALFHFWARRRPKEVTGHIVKISGTTASHAYAVNASMYDRILAHDPAASSVDWFYKTVVADKYATPVDVAWQREGFSDTEGKVIDRTPHSGVV